MSAQIIREHILAPALDGIARNHRQTRIIVNPTPEIDSIVEHVTELIRTAVPAQRPHLAALIGLCRDLLAENRAEGELERSVAGAADRLAVDLARAATVGQKPLGARSAARELRAPLANLANPIIQGTARDTALAAVRGVVARSTRDNVLSNTVRHELGPKRYQLLADIIDDIQAAERVAA
jgi:hypothetical protein